MPLPLSQRQALFYRTIISLVHKLIHPFVQDRSKYTQTGMFEVTKAEEEDENSGSPPSSPNPSAVTPAVPSSSKPSALRVTIPSELQGVAYIEVLCQKGTILLRNSII